MKKLVVVSLLLLTACGWDMDIGAWNLATEMCAERKSSLIAAEMYKPANSVYFRCADGYEGRVRRAE